jgi:pimeloyl-ACP methyl ester carboxylesterase
MPLARPWSPPRTRLPLRRPARLLVLATAAAVPAGLLGAAPVQAVSGARTAGPTAAAATHRADRTSPVEARRADSVPTPKLGWYPCYDYAECATVNLPLDYDQPKGAKVLIAVLRVKARDQRHKIGSLFVNPGGPGGSGAGMALAAPGFLSDSVLQRFDVVGFDPRGINFSDNVRCWRNNAESAKALAPLNRAFPYGAAEEKAWIAASKAAGRACSTTGRPLSASMSTAEVARDMDVLRRAVGDKKLSYLGFSYGSYLGQVYANLFPDRVRALVIDGVLDPIAWAGTSATASRPQTDRVRSADGSWRALHEILVRCDKAGGQKCAFAPGDPLKNLATIADRLKKHPLVISDPEFGDFTLTYADFVATLLGALYSPSGSEDIAQFLAQLWILTEPPARSTAAQRAAARHTVARLHAKAQAQATRHFDFPYDNSFEAFASVLCTDGRNPAHAESWPAAAAAADKRAPYFGRLWAWESSWCAERTWTARDEDVFRGPFTHRTSAPVLVVGDYWDPATRYEGAVTASKLLPNSRLLLSDSWGHTAYGTSACVTGSVDNYLLKLALPAKGKVCVGDVQPFQAAPAGARTTFAVPNASPVRKQLPPVTPLAP